MSDNKGLLKNLGTPTIIKKQGLLNNSELYKSMNYYERTLGLLTEISVRRVTNVLRRASQGEFAGRAKDRMPAFLKADLEPANLSQAKKDFGRDDDRVMDVKAKLAHHVMGGGSLKGGTSTPERRKKGRRRSSPTRFSDALGQVDKEIHHNQ